MAREWYQLLWEAPPLIYLPKNNEQWTLTMGVSQLVDSLFHGKSMKILYKWMINWVPPWLRKQTQPSNSSGACSNDLLSRLLYVGIVDIRTRKSTPIGGALCHLPPNDPLPMWTPKTDGISCEMDPVGSGQLESTKILNEKGISSGLLILNPAILRSQFGLNLFWLGSYTDPFWNPGLRLGLHDLF